MPWSALQSRTLCIDWANVASAIDPYLVWADATRFAGVRPALARAQTGFNTSDETLLRASVPIAFERSGNLSHLQLLAGLAELEQAATLAPPIPFGTRFGTWTVPIWLIALLHTRLGSFFERIELGVPTRAPGLEYLQWLTQQPPILGNGEQRVFAAVIDDGCAFANLAFLTPPEASPPRATRLARLWFQEDKTPVSGGNGFLGYSSADLDAFLQRAWQDGRLIEEKAYAALEAHLRPRHAAVADHWRQQMRKPATHGTHVLDVMAGTVNPLAGQGFGLEGDPAGAVPLIFVQLPQAAVADTSGASMNCNVMEALNYVASAVGQNDRVVVNLSYGALAGPHDGTSLLEEAIDDFLCCTPQVTRLTLPAGNGYDSCTHAQRALPAVGSTHDVMLKLLPEDPTDTFVELWYSPDNDAQGNGARVVVEVIAPDGTSSGTVRLGQYVEWLTSGSLPVAALLHVPSPTAGGGRKHLALLAIAATRQPDRARGSAPHGRWTIRLLNEGNRTAGVDAWIERDDAPFGSGRSRSQATFLSEGTFPARGVHHGAVEPIERRRCMNSFSHGAKPWVAGGFILQARVGMAGSQRTQALAPYSASGPGREAKAPLPGPTLCAPCERLPGVGLLAAGTRSIQPVYMNGTSVASAALARQLVNEASGKQLPRPDPDSLMPDRPHDGPLPAAVLRRGLGGLKPCGR